ncbi:MAG: PadR family transcriptional regulator [Chloroflexota bacterium]|nr:PadR family transcriptional regulator [Dehalococcoidia bacterium]MDW8253017.1 PadR family transcriptional regulator [Chloroflexota bacterium]
MNSGARHRQLMILGMLQYRPMYGHQIKEAIDQHMMVVSDLKRANLYYLLEQLTSRGYLEVRTETLEGATGPVEREIYYLTPAGRAYFDELLREVLSSFESLRQPVDVAMFFLPHLPRDQAIALLADRRAKVEASFAEVREQLATSPHKGEWHELTADHLISLYQLELDWLDRAIAKLEASSELQPTTP